MNKNNLILYYHSIGDYPLSVSSNDFECVIKKLSLHYKLVTVSELYLRHFTNKETSGLCSITFDDFFESAYINAKDILEKYNAKGTFYVSTGYIDNSLWGSIKQNKWSNTKDKNYNIEFKMMTWNMIDKLIKNGHEIGCHTINHPNLIECSQNQLFNEINTSKSILEERLDKKIKTFAYPRGVFSNREKDLVKSVGYENAVTTINGYVYKSDDTFSICRMPGPGNLATLKYMISSPIIKFFRQFYGGMKSRLYKV